MAGYLAFESAEEGGFGALFQRQTLASMIDCLFGGVMLESNSGRLEGEGMLVKEGWGRRKGSGRMGIGKSEKMSGEGNDAGSRSYRR